MEHKDMNLFDFGFNHLCTGKNNLQHISQSSYALHVTCALSLHWNNSVKEKYYCDCDKVRFEKDIQNILNQKVEDISFGENNALILRFPNCSIVVVPADDGKESWRLFECVPDAAHLVVADTWIHSTETI